MTKKNKVDSISFWKKLLNYKERTMKKKILLFATFLVLVFVVSKAVTTAQEKNEEEFEKIAKVQEVKISEITETREFSGIVKGVGEIAIAPEISGRLLSINKKEGEIVKKGEVLATIDPTNYLAQNSLSVEQTKVSEDALAKTDEYQDKLVDIARIELQKAEDVKKEAKKGSDESAIKLAKRNVEEAEEAVRTAKRMRDLQTSLAQGQIDVSQKQANISAISLNNTKIKAPFDGIFTKKLLQEGEIVSPQTKIFVLVQSEEKEIEIDLPAEVARKMTVGQEISVIKDTNGGEEFIAKVDSISPVSDEITRKSGVKFIFDNENVILGEFVRVLIPISEKKSVIAIPISSIKKSYFENVVFVVEDGLAKEQRVDLGIIESGLIEITRGLEKGAILVIEGQQNLRNGDNVRIYEQ